MSPEERADKVLREFYQTLMGNLGSRYDDPNHVRGVTVGKARQLIEQQVREAEAAMKERCAKVAEDMPGGPIDRCDVAAAIRSLD